MDDLREIPSREALKLRAEVCPFGTRLFSFFFFFFVPLLVFSPLWEVFSPLWEVSVVYSLFLSAGCFIGIKFEATKSCNGETDSKDIRTRCCCLILEEHRESILTEN